MRKSNILLLSFILILSFLFTFNCSMDESVSEIPEVQLKDQVVSVAVGNGDSTRHTGNTFLLDWNGDSAEDGTNPQSFPTIPVHHVTSSAPRVENYLDLSNDENEGGDEGNNPHEMIDPVWDTVDWTTLNLSLIDDGVDNHGAYATYPSDEEGPYTDITQLNVKAIFNYQDRYVAFLFQWDDPSKNYKKDLWDCIHADPDHPDSFGYGVWERRLDYDSDWLAMMFSTWAENRDSDDTLLGFVEMHENFQEQGCNSTCHTDDRPYHFNEEQMEDPLNPGTYVDQVCDLWYWDASRTNYGDPTDVTPLGGEMFDGHLNSEGGVDGDRNDPEEEYSPDDGPYEEFTGWIAFDEYHHNFQYDDGTPPYFKNSYRVPNSGPNIAGYTHWYVHPDNVGEGTGNIWRPYLWVPIAFVGTAHTYQGDANAPFGIRYNDPGNPTKESTYWTDDSIVTGWYNRGAMGNCSSIRSTGYYNNGTWTVEIVRDLDTDDSNDVNLNIYDPAGQQEE